MTERVFHPGLEGLRGISVLAVLIFHSSPTLLPGGFLGVSTFFTLSGFLITGLLAREWEATGTIKLRAFWGRRLRRLLPASLLALLGIACAGAFLADVTQREHFTGDGLSALFYVSNWWLISSGADYASLMGSPSPLQHFWSLSIEEQYYFSYPLVCVAVLRATSGRKRSFAALLIAASCASWVWMAWLATTDVTTARLYYGTDTRVAELMAGGALALLMAPSIGGETKKSFVVAGLFGALLSMYGWGTATVESIGLYNGGLAIYTLCSIAMILAAIQPGGPLRSALSFAPVRWLGRISYGAYVYHWPIFLWVDNSIVGIALTLAVAELSYRTVEEPIRSGRRVIAWRRFALPLATIGAVAIAFILAVPESSEMSRPTADTTRLDEAIPNQPPLRIVVVGDSLAHNVGEGLQGWAKQTKQALVLNLAQHGCGIARGAWPERDLRHNARCDRWPEANYMSLAKYKPDVVVVTTAGWDLLPRQTDDWSTPRVIGDPDFNRWLIEQYVESVDYFRVHNTHVVWLTTPCFVHRGGDTTGTWDPARNRALNTTVLPAVARARPDQMTLIDFAAVACPGGVFTNSLHGIDSFRPDGTHFSRAAQVWLGEWLGEKLLALPRQPKS